MFVVQAFEIEGSHATTQPCLDARKRETWFAAGASKGEGQGGSKARQERNRSNTSIYSEAVCAIQHFGVPLVLEEVTPALWRSKVLRSGLVSRPPSTTHVTDRREYQIAILEINRINFFGRTIYEPCETLLYVVYRHQ